MDRALFALGVGVEFKVGRWISLGADGAALQTARCAPVDKLDFLASCGQMDELSAGGHGAAPLSIFSLFLFLSFFSIQ